MHRYLHWFGGTFDEPESFPLLNLMNHLESAEFHGVDEDTGTIRISLIVEEPKASTRALHVVWIDPSRGFFPIRTHYRIEHKSYPARFGEFGDAFFMEYLTDVQEMKEVEGVWCPWRVSEIAYGQLSVAKEYANMWTTQASEISIGRVTPDMLAVEFPPDTRIHDRIRGEFIGFNASAPNPKALTAPTRERNWMWLVVVNGVVIVSMAMYATWRRRHQRSVKDN